MSSRSHHSLSKVSLGSRRAGVARPSSRAPGNRSCRVPGRQWAWSFAITAAISTAICFGSPPPLLAQDELPAPATPATSAETSQNWRLVGTGSCTAAGCHGAGHSDRTTHSEYNIWISRDKHARAYSTLFDERSQRMTQLLSRLSSTPTPPAHENPRCLACHSTADTPAVDTHRDVVTDGVGCEACHGPAEGWLAAHSQHPLSAEEREHLGMWDTKRLLTRAQVCVRCHVGSPGRDVNHDLIAAGHPRLQFEFTSYLEAMPKHWDESRDRARIANFDTQAWALGQASASQAALTQLAVRAEHGSSWPEFSEWSCSACHHDLRGDESRQARLAQQGNLSGRRINWDSWNYYITREHAPHVSQAFGLPGDAASKAQDGIRQLSHDMQGLNPDRHSVALAARSASDAVGAWAATLEHAKIDRPRLDRLTRAIVTQQAADYAYDWSNAAQLYDALASLHQTRLQLAAKNGSAAVPTDEQLTSAIGRLYGDLSNNEVAQARDQIDNTSIGKKITDVERLLPPERATP
jgi:cytochrome c554/c'-like protein